MAIKFFKSLSGLSKLFKTTTKSGDSSLSPTTLDNITDIAKNQGVNENSIVHATCSESDTTEFGAQYLPGTDVLVVNGSPLVDAKNIVSGISMQVYSGYPVFIAPRGVLKATDVVRIAKIQRTTVGTNGGVQTKGLTIPVWDNTKSVVFGNVTYLPIITLSRLNTTLASDLMEKWRMKVATSTGTIYEINEQELNTILAAQGPSNQMIDYTGTIAFSIWRNGVQVSDWFKWYNDGKILRTEKGLYLPGVQNITYSQLMTKIKTSKLIQGRKYRITDYKPTSAYWNIIPYNTPETSQLIVTAIANDILDENATLVVNLQPYEVKYSVYRRDHSAGVVYNAPFTCDVAGSTVTMTRVDDLGGISTSSLYAIYNDWLSNQTIENAFKGTLYYGFQGEEICFALIPYRIDKAPVGSNLPIQVVNLAQLESSQTTFTIDSDSWLDEYTGEIYYMRDAYGNEANFDFKGYRYTSRDTELLEYYFPFGGSDDCSESGECQNNKFLNLEQYNRTESGVKNLTIESYDVVNRVFDASCSGRIYKDAFVKSDGSSSEFLMADGSTLNGIKAKATSVAANVNPEVTFNNGTFNFKIPSGVNGEKGDKGDTGATGATGVGITDIKDSGETGSGAARTITVTLSDTSTKTFTVYNGEKGEQGEKGDTGSVASLTQTDGSVVTSVKLGTDKSLTVTRGNIGGRNYILGSSKVLTSTGDNTANKGYVNIGLDFSEDIYKHAGEAAYLSVDIKLENAIAAEKVGGSTSIFTRLGLLGKMNQTGNTSEEIYITREISTSTAETLTTRLTKQITIPKGAISKNYLGLYIQGLKSGTATISNPKLELGSVPTDWSVAPEDGDLYTNATAMPVALGGCDVGTTFNNMTIKEVLDKLLYPYMYPTSSIDVNYKDWEMGVPTTLTFTVSGTARQAGSSISIWQISSDGINWSNTDSNHRGTAGGTTSSITRYGRVLDSNGKVSEISQITSVPKYRCWIIPGNASWSSNYTEEKLKTLSGGGLYAAVGNIKGEKTIETTSSAPYVYIILPKDWAISFKAFNAPFTAFTTVKEEITYTPTKGTKSTKYKIIKFDNSSTTSTTFTIV